LSHGKVKKNLMKCPKCQFENARDTLFCGQCGTRLPRSDQGELSATKTLETPIKELAVGTAFAGRYQIVEDLGKGGMGRVYKALDNEIGERVALKILKPEIAADEQTIERFRNELKTARQISHKNICRMYHLGREHGTYYITMEYVSGEDLKSTVLRVGQLSVGKTVSIIAQVCEGLAEAHRLGVVHRDLKPQNIMIDKAGNAKIMDFGIARSVKAKGLTEAGVMIGTPEYMSPEQVDGQEADQRADIYALGIILFELLTGRVPFEGETPFSVAYKQKNELPPSAKKLNPQIPEDLDRLILKCLEKDKTKRFQNAADVLAELVKIEKALPSTERVIVSKKPLTSRQVTVTFGLKKAVIPAAVVVAVIITAIVLWLVWPEKAQAKHSIAVINFRNQTGDKAYDYLQEAIPNLLITSLEQSKYLSVMTWERMRDLLKQAGEGDAGIIDSDLGFELCRRDGVDNIVLGSFIKAGDTFATDVKVHDVRTKALLKSASSQGQGVSSILEKQIGELSKEIARAVGLSGRKVEVSQASIADLTTSSMEAYEYYLKAQDQFDKLYYDEARKLYEKAIDLDPGFAIAYVGLAYAANGLGDSKERDRAFERANALSGKTSEKERLYIEENYAGVIKKDPAKQLSILQELVQKYPKEKLAHYMLGQYYRDQQQLQEAVEEFGKAVELDPSYGLALNQMAYSVADLGDLERAVEIFGKYASLFPGDANPVDSMAEMYFRMGRLDEAILKYQEALKIKPDFFGSAASLAYVYALKEDYDEAMNWIDRYIAIAPSPQLRGIGYFYRTFLNLWCGRYTEAAAETDLLKTGAEAVAGKEGAAAMGLLKAWVLFEQGHFDLTRPLYKQWYDVNLLNPLAKDSALALYDFYDGFVDMATGRLDEAKNKLASFKAVLPNIGNFPIPRVAPYLCGQFEGELLLRLGSVDKAIAVLEKAPSLGAPPAMRLIVPLYVQPFPMDALARAHRAKGDIDRAITEYEKLATFDPARPERTWINPKYHFRLAQLYKIRSMREQAIGQYKKFLDLWKNADPDNPELAEAKKALAELQRQP
jgi:tetratricopeptide (TPR) repeat protein/tRNA A-37 threonylcarbamoyl transferase component Bud32